jgi:hypothetical protein
MMKKKIIGYFKSNDIMHNFKKIQIYNVAEHRYPSDEDDRYNSAVNDIKDTLSNPDVKLVSPVRT